MRITRTLTGLAITAAFVATAPLAADAATGPSDAVATTTVAKNWGSYYAPGRAAKAFGSLTATGEDHEDLPTADTVKISGKVYDLTRSRSCGWAVFRITYRSGNNLPFKHGVVRDCSYGSPKKFAVKYHDVYQVELKVCSEPKAAQPSLNCLYAGTWKVLYLSK
ncbi:hypothetical protein Sme01_44810 [Sphaerisporangium melleum]|uniref:Secreted protein n=1 Tax=Sphaerisporangium melleum TaxID=321316 RepID=A0A917R1D2_9ACTN|nr:hypothetical protein [Sphaerisporangium melleum]GGK80770.1 hypothetical protein GCM10007964_24280 [Sphaerisporangium melleum]GII72005.1 hypothetical protein Sme01_44810 [Sphaerisporangium melleum]